MARAKATSIKLSQFPHFEDSVAQNVVVCFSAEAFYIISISAEFLSAPSPPSSYLPPPAAWLALSVRSFPTGANSQIFPSLAFRAMKQIHLENEMVRHIYNVRLYMFSLPLMPAGNDLE